MSDLLSRIAAAKPTPITREEFDRFIELCSTPPKLPKPITITVHPSDLEATKKFFGIK